MGATAAPVLRFAPLPIASCGFSRYEKHLRTWWWNLWHLSVNVYRRTENFAARSDRLHQLRR